jgi:hypothetical protein
MVGGAGLLVMRIVKGSVIGGRGWMFSAILSGANTKFDVSDLKIYRLALAFMCIVWERPGERTAFKASSQRKCCG